MKYSLIYLIGIITLVLFSTCAKENRGDCFKSNGKIVTIEREISGFNSVKTEDKMDVYLSQASYYSLRIEGGKNLLSNIKTTVSDSILTLDNINKCNFIRNPKHKIKIYITAPRIKYVRNGGVGNVYYLNRFIQDTLDIRIGNSGNVFANVDLKYLHTSTHGNGDIHIEGLADYGNHYTSGTNYLYFENLIYNNRVDLNSYTIGHCYINAPKGGEMNLSIWESGNIYYKGNPLNIKIETHGKGQLIQQ